MLKLSTLSRDLQKQILRELVDRKINSKLAKIQELLSFYNITNYRLNADSLKVSTERGVSLVNLNLSTIPIVFERVEGNFDCSSNNLKSLKNSPRIVVGNFTCSSNPLETLEDLPSSIVGDLILPRSIRALYTYEDIRKISTIGGTIIT